MIMERVPRFAAGVVAISGVVAAMLVATREPDTWGVMAGGMTWGVRVDAVSAVLLGFVGFLTSLVAGYAATNLHGQARLAKFSLTFTIVVAALALMVVGSNLVLVALGWTVSGWGIASLIAHPQSIAARRASRFVRAHLVLSDVALWMGVLIAALTLPTVDRGSLESGSSMGTLTVVSCFVVAGALRSGLFPFHRWLPETAEAPSPVSALLHAGLVNGAGIIALICWPLYRAAPAALVALIIFGLFSIVVGTLNSRVRADVKGQLACSTTAQMGYMGLQIGLGLPAAALLHLVGHGCYKSWLFLRAGGAITRGRLAVGRTAGRRSGSWLGACFAMSIAVLGGVPAVASQTGGAVGLLPAALAFSAAAAAGAGVGGQRAAVLARVGVVAAAGLAAAGYMWLLVGWEHLLGTTISVGGVFSDGTGVVLLFLLIAAGVLTAFLARNITRTPSGALATALCGTGLPPWSRRIGGNLRRASAGPVVVEAERDMVEVLVRTAGTTASPAWPLRELVAANPLAGLSMLPFDEAVAGMEDVHGSRMHLPLASYLDLFDSGRIAQESLQAALAEYVGAEHGSGRAGAAEVAEFVRGCRDGTDQAPSQFASIPALRWSQAVARTVRRKAGGTVALDEVADDHAAWWTQRAWARVGEVRPGPWQLWREAAARPLYDRAIGVSGASAWVRGLPEDPTSAISELLRQMDLRPADALGHVVAILASGPGWASHAQWRSRQHGTLAPLLEVVALRMAFDVLAARSHGADKFPGAAATTTPVDATTASSWKAERIWQRAWEMGIHQGVLTTLTTRGDTAAARVGPPLADLVFCIDVRSERLRRSIEVTADIRTHGFAGFFGAAIRVQDATGRGFDQCPALIKPSVVVPTTSRPPTVRQLVHRGVTSTTSTPLLALLVAEATGVLSGMAALAASLIPVGWRRASGAWVRGSSEWDDLDPTRAGCRNGHHGTPPGHTLKERVDIASGMLRTVGLVDGFAPLIVLCGHEAGVTNNAFAAAYDCGACGGNSGRANAQVVAAILNDPAVRGALAGQGIIIPAETLAIAAVHNTTTDELEMDPSSPGVRTHRRELDGLEAVTRTASGMAAAERMALLPARPGDRRRRTAQENLVRRSADWAEPMPEWGLAGNVAMVVGPRAMTSGLDLAGRVFLQSYDSRLDTEDHQILEQILTAPVVVGQWINAQYYFSTIAAQVFGAGDKTTHNVVGDVGVITGSHGDLRTGLPWQSLSPVDPLIDPLASRHEPVRLMVVVASPPKAVAEVLRRQPELHGLLANRWLRIVCLKDGQRDPMEVHPDLVPRPATTWSPESTTVRRAVPAVLNRRRT